MQNYIRIIKGHKDVADEHVVNYNIDHVPTYIQATFTLIVNLIKCRKYIEYNGAYILYESEAKYTLGIAAIANVVGVYVPKDKRGNGYVNVLLDLVADKHECVVSFEGKDSDECGRLYRVR